MGVAAFPPKNIFDKKYLTLWVMGIYLILPWIFFGINFNILQNPLAPGDGIVGGLPTKIFSATFSAWNPYIQSGTFVFKDIGFQALYLPAIIIMRLFPSPFGYNLLMLLHYFLAGFFTYLFLKRLKLASMASFIGGVVFMFSGFLSAHLGHFMIVITTVYLPIVLYFIESFLSSRRYIFLFFAALAFALSIFADYTAVSMYIGMICFPYIIFRVMTGDEFRQGKFFLKTWWAILISFAVFVGGLLIAAAQVFPILESLPNVTRQKITYEFFASYSLPLSQLPSLIFPYLFGSPVPNPIVSPTPYFGAWNLTELTGYIGILPLLFAALSLWLLKKNSQVIFWVSVSALAFLLALGNSTPFYEIMYKVPVYNMFRVPARNWLEMNFAIAVLSAIFINAAMNGALKKYRYYRALNHIIAVFFVCMLFILKFWDQLFPRLARQKGWLANIQITSPAVYVPLIIFFFSALALYLLRRYKNSPYFWSAIALFIFLDLFAFGHYYAQTPTLLFFQNRPNDVFDFLSAREKGSSSYRVYSLNNGSERELRTDFNMLYHIASPTGYSNIWLSKYSQLTTFGVYGALGNKNALLTNNTILSVLSTKYLITSDPTDKELLSTLKVETSKNERSFTVIDGPDEKKWSWNNISPGKIANQIVTLRANPGAVSLIQAPFEIQPDLFYTVTFKAKLTDIKDTSEPLIVDLWGERYDFVQQEAQIDKTILSNKFREFKVKFFSGSKVPKSANLRFFTFSEIPFEIKDIKLIQENSSNMEIPYWGTDQPTDENFPVYKKVYETPDGIAVYENLNYLPRARFAQNIAPIENFGEVLYRFWYDTNFNPATTTLVEGYNRETTIEPGQVLTEDYSNNSKVRLTVQTGKNGFLILADTWYPGWEAYIDGQRTEIYVTNGVQRGIYIEGAGTHAVEFRFVSKSSLAGVTVSLATILIFAGLTIYLTRRDKARQTPQPVEK